MRNLQNLPDKKNTQTRLELTLYNSCQQTVKGTLLRSISHRIEADKQFLLINRLLQSADVAIAIFKNVSVNLKMQKSKLSPKLTFYDLFRHIFEWNNSHKSDSILIIFWYNELPSSLPDTA